MDDDEIRRTMTITAVTRQLGDGLPDEWNVSANDGLSYSLPLFGDTPQIGDLLTVWMRTSSRPVFAFRLNNGLRMTIIRRKGAPVASADDEREDVSRHE
jgi:hypothetical protein